MSNLPEFRFFLYRDDNRVRPGDEDWDFVLPLAREKGAAQTLFRSRTFFQAARNFLGKNRFSLPARAFSIETGRKIDPDELDTVDICIEKHGAFYHPARITVKSGHDRVCLVLNLAVSDPGKEGIEKECAALTRLHEQGCGEFIPSVYGMGEEEADGIGVSMFLAKWFTGFNEFHLSPDPEKGGTGIVVWDPEKGPYFPDARLIRTLYARIAEVLTRCYRPDTFEQILFWHHEAGDFILSEKQGNLSVRLITVRGYGPLFHSDPIQEEETESRMVENLMVFFLDMSVRTRLDRIDGTKDMAWAPDISLAGTVEGFFLGLTHLTAAYGFPRDFPRFFHAYLKKRSLDDFSDLLRQITGNRPSETPESLLLRSNLSNHAAALIRILHTPSIRY